MQHTSLQSPEIGPVVFSTADLAESAERRDVSGPTRKVLLVVAGRLFRDGLRSLMHASGLTVVGHCDTLEEACPLIARIDKPDLIMVDMRASATEIQALRARLPGTRWILLCDRNTSHDSLVGAGFDWILFQDISAEILHHVVELMLLGHSLQPRSPLASPPVLNSMQASAEVVILADARQPELPRTPLPETTSPPRAPGMLPLQDLPRQRSVHLSDRETEILQCLVNGAPNKAIARELNIAEATVKVHVKGLLRKMQLQNRTQAAIWAVSNPLSPKRVAPERDI